MKDSIQDFLKQSATFNNSIILVTDRDKILFDTLSEKKGRALTTNYKNELRYMHEHGEVLKVFNCYKIHMIESNTQGINNQCIALILDEDIMIGSIVILNHDLDFEAANYSFMSSVLRTLKTMLKEI